MTCADADPALDRSGASFPFLLPLRDNFGDAAGVGRALFALEVLAAGALAGRAWAHVRIGGGQFVGLFFDREYKPGDFERVGSS